MEDVITLCKNEPTLNKYKISVDNFVCRDVFCDIDSATRSEFYQASAVGLRPELEASIFRGDYEGEKVAIYGGEEFQVIRTYKGSTDYRTNASREDSDRIILTLAKGIGNREAGEDGGD